MAYSQLTKTFKEKKEKTNFHESDSSENKSNQTKKSLPTWSIFLFSVSIVIICLVSVVFPALIASSNSAIGELQDLGISLFPVDPFVQGVWTNNLIISNIVVFGLAILYFKKKLPDSITKLFNFIFTFEVSKKVATITIVVFLGIYVGASLSELTQQEKWEDYFAVNQRIENWNLNQVTTSFEPHVRYFFIWASKMIFGFDRVIPFLASIALLITVYFFTKEITKKRFAGIVSMIIVLQSNVFLAYDSTVSYTNFWILFYLLSLFMIFKVWPISPLFYILSIFSKALTAIFLPMSIFFFYRSKVPPKTKLIVIASSIAVILIGLGVVFAYDVNLSGGTGEPEDFDSDEFWLGFTSFSYQLRFDGLVLIFILPLIVGLFIASRYGVNHADSIMLLIGGILLTAPLVTGFTELTNQPYRFVPVVVFFSVGVGILLSKRKN